MPGNCSLTAETSFRGNVFSIAERARRIVLSNKSLRPAVSLVRFNPSRARYLSSVASILFPIFIPKIRLEINRGQKLVVEREV